MDDFDRFLKTRHVPDAPSNLSHRIIEASQALDRKASRRNGILRGALDTVAGWFSIPKPAYAFACVAVLMLGLAMFMGDYSLLETSSVQETPDDVALAFYVDDILGADIDGYRVAGL